MPQLFHRGMNTLARLSIVVGLLVAGVGLMIVIEFNRTPYVTQAFVAREQPVQFSHKHHVGDDGIDCRYCHTTVETAATAGLPATKTCMNWHDLPDFAYFNHSIHVNKGVGCSTCHGRVDMMPLMWNEASLHMEWCLQCHRNPNAVLREQKDITNMEWVAPKDHAEKGGAELAKKYNIQPKNVLTSCSTCHR